MCVAELLSISWEICLISLQWAPSIFQHSRYKCYNSCSSSSSVHVGVCKITQTLLPTLTPYYYYYPSYSWRWVQRGFDWVKPLWVWTSSKHFLLSHCRVPLTKGEYVFIVHHAVVEKKKNSLDSTQENSTTITNWKWSWWWLNNSCTLTVPC